MVEPNFYKYFTHSQSEQLPRCDGSHDQCQMNSVNHCPNRIRNGNLYMVQDGQYQQQLRHMIANDPMSIDYNMLLCLLKQFHTFIYILYWSIATVWFIFPNHLPLGTTYATLHWQLENLPQMAGDVWKHREMTVFSHKDSNMSRSEDPATTAHSWLLGQIKTECSEVLTSRLLGIRIALLHLLFHVVESIEHQDPQNPDIQIAIVNSKKLHKKKTELEWIGYIHDPPIFQICNSAAFGWDPPRPPQQFPGGLEISQPPNKKWWLNG